MSFEILHPAFGPGRRKAIIFRIILEEDCPLSPSHRLYTGSISAPRIYMPPGPIPIC